MRSEHPWDFFAELDGVTWRRVIVRTSIVFYLIALEGDTRDYDLMLSAQSRRELPRMIGLPRLGLALVRSGIDVGGVHRDGVL